MTELGSRLKEARKSKGLSLEDLQSLTKIQKRYLIGIEEGNYSIMPGSFYVRAFIKQYAEAVGLDPDEIFEQYKSDIPANSNQDLPEKLSRVKSRQHIPKDDSKIVQVLPKILLALGVVVLVFVFWLFYQNADRQSTDNNAIDRGLPVERETNPEVIDNNSDVDNETEEPNDVPEEEPVVEEEELPTTGTLQLVNQSGSNSTFTLSNTDRFDVEIVGIGRPWLDVKNTKGKVFYSAFLEEGSTEVFDFSNEEGIYFNIGNITMLNLLINDEPFEFPSEVVRQGITIQFEKETEE